MAAYLLILHNAGEEPTRTEIECVDDNEALVTAGRMAELCHVDVWKEGNLVGLVPRRSSAATPG